MSRAFPFFRNAGVEAEPGERRLLSAVVLQAEDADTPAEKLFYLLHAAPRFGRLRLEVTPTRSFVSSLAFT